MTSGSDVVDGPPPPGDDAWWQAIRDRIATPGAVRTVLQPIVDLQRGAVVGHEALTRIAGPPAASPDRWFAAAEANDLGARLAAATIERALAQVPDLPANTFLTVNCEPQHLCDPDVLAVLCPPGGSLQRVVVELTEHASVTIDRLRASFERIREAGGRIAIDDAGAGYAGLAMLLDVRPELVKLDRSLVTGLDTDPARRVLVQAIGELTASIDAWVLAEGIETLAELETLVRLGVPLGQGYLLGRPAPEFTPDIPIEAADAIQGQVRRGALDDLVVSLLQRVTTIRADDASASPPVARVIVDALDRPVALDLADGTRTSRLLLAKPSEPIASVARRVAARPEGDWSTPVVLTDGRGVTVGIVPVPSLLERLAR